MIPKGAVTPAISRHPPMHFCNPERLHLSSEVGREHQARDQKVRNVREVAALLSDAAVRRNAHFIHHFRNYPMRIVTDALGIIHRRFAVILAQSSIRMKQPNVTSIAVLAREHGCSRQAIYNVLTLGRGPSSPHGGAASLLDFIGSSKALCPAGKNISLVLTTKQTHSVGHGPAWIGVTCVRQVQDEGGSLSARLTAYCLPTRPT